MIIATMTEKSEIQKSADNTVKTNQKSRSITLSSAELAPREYEDWLKAQAEVFERESSAVLHFGSDAEYSPFRYEPRRNFIIKVLLYIGVLPDGNAMAVIAWLIETLSCRPDLSVDEAIDRFSDIHDTNSAAIMRIIDKNLNVYNADLYDRTESITDSRPMTSKDVLCDLALFVRLKYMSYGRKLYE